jgi:hypothetical protein
MSSRPQKMAPLIVICFTVVGGLLGLLSAAGDDWATRVVMMAVGVLFAAPIGAALARIRAKRSGIDWDDDLRAGAATSPKNLAKNYWRDKGHPPFAKPTEAPPDKHIFDPDKLA